MAASITGVFTLLDRASGPMRKMEAQAVKTMAAIEGVGAAQDRVGRAGGGASTGMSRQAQATERLRSSTAQTKTELGRLAGEMNKTSRASDGLMSKLRRLGGAASGLRAVFGLLQLGAIGIGIASLVQGVGVLAGGFAALVPAVAQASGALAALPATFGAVIQGVLGLKAAMGGVGEAMKAGTAQQQGAARAAQDYGRQQQAAADGIRGAERSLALAQRSSGDAQRSLTEARRQATRELVDMRLAARGAVLGEQRAALSLREARASLDRVSMDPGSTDLDIQSARLGVREAQLAMRNAKVERNRATADNRRAQKAGVGGSDTMRSARRAAADATYQQAEATRALARAQEDARIQMERGEPALDAYQEAMEKLSPQAQRFVRTMIAMRPAMQAMRQGAQESFFREINAGMSSAVRLLPVFQRGLAQTGAVLGRQARAGMEEFSTPDRLKDISAIMRHQAGILGRFGSGLRNVIAGFLDLALAARPFTNWLTRTVEGWTDMWRASMAAGRASGRTAGFLERTRAVLERFGRIVRNVWITIRELARAATPLGERLWDGAERATEGWANFMQSAYGATRARGWFDSLYEPLHALGQLTKALVSAWARITVAPGFAETVNGLTRSVPHIERLLIGLAGMGPSAAALLEQIVRLLSNLPFNPLTLLLDALTRLLQMINWLVERVPRLGTVLSALITVALVSRLMKYVGGVKMLAGAWAAVRAAAVGATAAQAIAAAGAGRGVVGRVGGIAATVLGATAAGRLARRIPGLGRLLGGGAAAGAGAGGAAAGGVGALAALRGAPGRLGAWRAQRAQNARINRLANYGSTPEIRDRARAVRDARAARLGYAGGPAGGGGLGGRLGGGGRLAQVGRFAKFAGGPALIAGSIGAGVLGDAVGGKAGGALAGAGMGAGLGATLGSVVPVLGTGIGAAIGGVAGGILGLINAPSKAEKALAKFGETADDTYKRLAQAGNEAALRRLERQARDFAKTTDGEARTALENFASQVDATAGQLRQNRLELAMRNQFLGMRRMTRSNVRGLLRNLGQLEPGARTRVTQQMVAMAQEMERRGVLPKGSTRRLRRGILRQLDGLKEGARNRTLAMVRAIGTTITGALPGLGRLMGLLTPENLEKFSKGTVKATGFTPRELARRALLASGAEQWAGALAPTNRAQERQANRMVLTRPGQVRRFQTAHGLAADGVVGPQTKAALKAENVVVRITKRQEKAVKDSHRRTAADVKRSNERRARDTERSFRGTQSTVGRVNGDIREKTGAAWAQTNKSISAHSNAARREAGQAFDGLMSDTMKALTGMGISRSEASRIMTGKGGGGAGNVGNTPGANGQKRPNAKGGRINYAGGGRIGGVGLLDTVPVAPNALAAPGELIVNRHTEQKQNMINRAVGAPPLGRLVAGETRPHSAMRQDTSNHTFGGRVFFARGGYVQGAQPPSGPNSGPIRALANALFAKGFNVTSGGEYRGTGTNHDAQKALDLGDSVNDLRALSRVLMPKRAQLEELFGPAAYMGLWKRGTKFSDAGLQAGHEDHVHVAAAQMVAGALRGASAAGGGGQIDLKRRRTGLAGAPGALSQAAMDHARTGMLKTANDALGAQGGASGAYGPAPKGQVRAWLTRALRITGHFSPANLNALYSRVMQESGGNPRAINLWDSNAAAGIPSKGLIQTIDPTFNAHKLPGMDNIWNPVHNAVAAIRYMFSRYGHIVGANGQGYELGGRLPGGLGGADWGGWHKRGGRFKVDRPTVFGAGENGSETVSITPRGAAGGGGGATINVTIGKIVNNREGDIEEALEKALSTVAERVGLVEGE